MIKLFNLMVVNPSQVKVNDSRIFDMAYDMHVEDYIERAMGDSTQ